MADEQNSKKKRNQTNSAIIKEIAPYFGLGSQIAFTILAATFLGYWIDGEYGTSPVWTIVFAITGLITGMYSFLRKVLKNEKKSQD